MLSKALGIAGEYFWIIVETKGRSFCGMSATAKKKFNLGRLGGFEWWNSSA
ncbi:hypothetical protein [Microcoleus sp. herbarium12]|uniref:hypothetical protein n=1 Tax=Microcoleus sp. herbarium12 TaxID=3055437 RepID=UPI002FD3BAEB